MTINYVPNIATIGVSNKVNTFDKDRFVDEIKQTMMF
jgi:hypothetical protein